MSVNMDAYPSQDRILGSAAVIDIVGPTGYVQWAAVDEFNAESQTKTTDFQPLGATAARPQNVYGGYKLTFSGGKLDETIEGLFYGQDQLLLSGQAGSRFRVTETVKLLNGTEQTWIYPDTALNGFKKSVAKATDPIKYDFNGDSPIRYPAG